MEWAENALCRGMDAAHFYPAERSRVSKKVRQMCAACPVRERCLQHAIDNNEEDGFWGGMDHKERAALVNGRTR